MTYSKRNKRIDEQHDRIDARIGRTLGGIALVSICLGIGSCGKSAYDAASNSYTGAPQVRRCNDLGIAVRNIDMAQEILVGKAAEDIPKYPEIMQGLESERKKLSEAKDRFQALLEKARQDPVYEKFAKIESRRGIYNCVGLILMLGIPILCAVASPCFSWMNGKIGDYRLRRSCD